MGEARRRRVAGLMPEVIQDLCTAVDAPLRTDWMNDPAPDYTVFDRTVPHCDAVSHQYRDKTGAIRYVCRHPGRAL